MEVAAEEAEEVVEEEEPEVELDLNDSLKIALKNALVHDGLRRGLHECAKALDRRTAKLCCLAGDCDSDEFKTLVQALSDEAGVPLVTVDTRRQLGEFAGLSKINAEGEVSKVVNCSVAVVTDFGTQSKALDRLMSLIQPEA